MLFPVFFFLMERRRGPCRRSIKKNTENKNQPSNGGGTAGALSHPNLSRFVVIERSYQGRNIWDDPIIEKSQDRGQGQDQDHLLLQRSALPHYLVLALTLTLVLVLRFFNYRVVPNIPSLLTSPENGHGTILCKANNRIDDMNLHKKKASPPRILFQ